MCEEMSEVAITESIFLAQQEAEKEVESSESIEPTNDDSEVLPEIPKLLGLRHEDLVEKTKDMMSKNQQLDLLLLKAESYSHFIAENQKRTRELWKQKQAQATTADIPMEEVIEVAETGNKRKKSSGNSKSKKSKSIEPETQPKRLASSIFEQPKSLIGGELLDYQLEGMQWLLSLWENGLSGILADEMGLGKTIQIISLIAYLREHNTPGPYLIAAPLATISNWINEFHKWLPTCPVILYHGSKADRELLRRKEMPLNKSKLLDFPIVITSYEIIMIDKKFLEKYHWQYLILDEGHRIKNKSCKLLQNLKTFKSVSRLLLTGTPIQNTLEELWSLLNFCSPMIFDDLYVFQSWFGFKNIGRETQVDEIVDNEQSQRIVSKLHEILRPFLLRRLKKDVLKDKLPRKCEIVVYCPMTRFQTELYECVAQGTLKETCHLLNIPNAKHLSEINKNMNQRKVCNHPFLFGIPHYRDRNRQREIIDYNPEIVINISGKLKILDDLLEAIFHDHHPPREVSPTSHIHSPSPALGQRTKPAATTVSVPGVTQHKVLIFSQMIEVLNIIEMYLELKKYEFVRFDGTSSREDRQEAIDRFNTDDTVQFFLLSTRAGGLGINLTRADTVIIYDSDWNPHQDSQAQDRAHRIGQTKPVMIYRLITTNSVEISMLEKQVSKKKLERLTIQGGDYRKAGVRGHGMSITNLRMLLEDDVKSLQRMVQRQHVIDVNASHVVDTPVEILKDLMSADASLDKDLYLSPKELELVTNRQNIFQADGSIGIPLEGEMYDVVISEAVNLLQSLH